MEDIFWQRLQLVIFDVDGTLYEQSKLRKIMLFKLLAYYIIRPWKYNDLLVLYHFRKEREKKAGFSAPDLQDEQYIWCAEKVNVSVQEVKKVVDKWIFGAPDVYLRSCMYPGVSAFLTDLKKYGIKTAVYSDYKSENKLKQMQIYVDMEISSTDKKVNSLKPLPNGLLEILSEMKITDKSNTLFIGDRFELDGLCAENAGIPFLLIKKEDGITDFYARLSRQLSQALNN